MFHSYPTEEGFLEKVYDLLENDVSLEGIHIPHSDVFFVRAALEERFKVTISLDQAEEYMKEAGWKDGGNN
jgi:hypothetical protein